MDLRQPVGGAYIASLEPADIASLKRTYDIVKAPGGATKDPTYELDALPLYFNPLSAMRAKLQSATSAIATSLEIPRISLAMPISSIIELSDGVPVSE